MTGSGPWTWSCAGSNGGSTASCSARLGHTVTGSAGTGGLISPTSQPVGHGDRATLTVSTHEGYAIATVTGCNGTLSGTTYTTGAITADCAVSASFRFTKVTPTVTLSANPSAPAVNQATTITATVTAPSGSSAIATGRVWIRGDDRSCTATLSNGSGGCALSYASAGDIALTGAYRGDANFVTASGSLILSVGKTALTPTTQTVNGSVGSPITASTAYTATGFTGAVSYAISPALPAGLSLSSTTGVIGGNPTATQVATTHTVTGTGATSGTATATANVTVNTATTTALTSTPNPSTQVKPSP
ncbi:MAG: putative Ig domain-containing protein [Candidatus Contendobacter sp.]|nr:putative Ig domain-containing protein [Candidatus Contendobacter sp.]